MSRCYFMQDYIPLTLIIPVLVITYLDNKMPIYLINSFSLIVYLFILLFQNYSYLDLWVLMCFTLSILTFRLYIYLDKTIDEQNIRMSLDEKSIYKKSFHKVFKPYQFKKIFDIATLKKSKHNKDFIKEGEPLTAIYYFPRIPKYHGVILKNKGTVLSYLNDGCWIGVIEFIFNISNDWDQWLFSVSIEANNHPIEYYEWDATSLRNLFIYSGDYGLTNSILLLWCKYLAVSVTKLNDHIACSMKAVAGDHSSKADTLPLYRYLSERGKNIEESIVKENAAEIDVIAYDEVEEEE